MVVVQQSQTRKVSTINDNIDQINDNTYPVISFLGDTSIAAKGSECHLWVGSESPSQLELWGVICRLPVKNKPLAHVRCHQWTYSLRSPAGVI